MEPAQKPIVGQVYRQNRNDREVRVLETLRVKEEGGAGWKDGVKHIYLDNLDGISYVRFLSDFLDKFTLIGESDASSEKDLHRGETHWVEPGKN